MMNHQTYTYKNKNKKKKKKEKNKRKRKNKYLINQNVKQNNRKRQTLPFKTSFVEAQENTKCHTIILSTA
jgi:hypothetical protein